MYAGSPRHVAFNPRHPLICHALYLRIAQQGGQENVLARPRTSLASRGWSHADLILIPDRSKQERSRGGLPSRFRFPIVCANRCASARHGFLGEGIPSCTSGTLMSWQRPPGPTRHEVHMLRDVSITIIVKRLLLLLHMQACKRNDVPRPRLSKKCSAHWQVCQHCMQMKERRSVIFLFFLRRSPSCAVGSLQ